MPNSINSTATIVLSNMKPLPDEEIPALWGQYIADSIGYLYGRELPHYFPDFVATCANVYDGGHTWVHATTVWDRPILRVPGHNRLYATFSPSLGHYGKSSVTTYDNLGTITWGIFGDLGTFNNSITYSQANTAGYTFNTTFSEPVLLDAYVSEGSWGRFQIAFSGTTTDPDESAAPLGSMVFRLSDIKMKTKWA